DGERLPGSSPQELDRPLGGRLRRPLEQHDRVQDAHAEQVARPREQLVRLLRRDHREDAAALPELERPETAHRAPDVALELHVEPLSVAAAQDDLAELQENAALHRERMPYWGQALRACPRHWQAACREMKGTIASSCRRLRRRYPSPGSRRASSTSRVPRRPP